MAKQNSEKTEKKQSVYEMVSTRFLKQLEKGSIPWQQPWTDAGPPQNLVSGRPYKGINVWLLSMLGYERNFFLTYDQVNALGGRVKKGEKSHIVVYWKSKEVKDNETHQMVKKSFLMYYKVFNVAQCEGLEKDKIPLMPHPNDPIQACEDIVANMPSKPEIKNEATSAFYNPQHDYVNMPRMDQFYESDGYYFTLFHALIHSTGHSSRLNREEVMNFNNFGSEPFSMEALTAEIGACYLMSLTGIYIEDFKNNAAYIEGWIKKLQDDGRFIVFACSQAQRAVNFILNTKQEKKENEPSIAEIGDDLPF